MPIISIVQVESMRCVVRRDRPAWPIHNGDFGMGYRLLVQLLFWFGNEGVGCLTEYVDLLEPLSPVYIGIQF